MSDFLLMGQSADPQWLSAPLCAVDEVEFASAGVRFALREQLGHLVLRGAVDSLQGAVHSVLGLRLPTQPLSSVHSTNYCLRWISPDEWLLTLPQAQLYDAEAALRAASDGWCALVDVSGGQTVLELSGPDAETVLKKSVPYDIHPVHFPVGKVVTVTLAKAQCVLSRLGDEHFELIIRRSFANYIWAWLMDASREFGVAVERR